MGDNKVYANVTDEIITGNGCRINRAVGCTIVGNNNRVTTATKCAFEGNNNTVTRGKGCTFIGNGNKCLKQEDCTFHEQDEKEEEPPQSGIGKDGRSYRWRAVLDARTGESFEERKLKKLLKPLKESELPPRNPRTGARDWIGAARLMDELEDLTYGRTKAPPTSDMPEWARELSGEGVVALDRPRPAAAAAAPSKPAVDCALCGESPATVAATQCKHAVVCGRCLSNQLGYERPERCKACSKK